MDIRTTITENANLTHINSLEKSGHVLMNYERTRSMLTHKLNKSKTS